MKLKQKVEELLPKISDLANQYGFEQEIEKVITKHHQFKLRLPFVGAFSVGKSTLLNTLLQEKRLLGVEIDPATCLPTELFYSEQERITWVDKTGNTVNLSREDLKNQNYPTSDQDAWVEVGLANPVLEKYQDLVLVDMPGWDSGLAEHSLAIDNYIHLSGAYCLTVRSTDGTLKQSIQEVLTELKMLNKPVVLIISRIDEISLDERQAVVESITEQVTSQLSKAPLKVVTTSARKKQIDGVEEALADVVALSDSIYSELVLKYFLSVFELIETKLNILLNEDNLSVEEAQLECEEVPKQLEELKAQLSDLIAQIENTLPSCIEAAKLNLTNNLKAQLNSLSSSAMNGGSIQNEVTTSLRSAFLTMIEQDFKPKVARQLKSLQNINDIAPTNLDISASFTASERDSDAKGIILSQVISFALTKVLTLVPQLKPFSVVIHAIATLFTSQVDRDMRREQQKEEANHYVLHTLIPQVVSQAESAIQANLEQIVENVKAEISKETERKAANKQESLMQLTEKLNSVKHQDDMQKREYRNSLEDLTQLYEQLKGGS
ncbi:dynamin family protein [Vibrio rotiferianus]|uniref:dynamin family protein n=1 Tax=Vibrio rotiferianus TaxID=190895 RepID=UPI0015F398DC|nr:dynamin family protein [Vibrio rotiferianus]